MAAQMWRIPGSRVYRGKGLAFIQDRGMLQPAMMTAKGNYLFSEYGVGVKALALVGTWSETLNFLSERPETCLEKGGKPEIPFMCHDEMGSLETASAEGPSQLKRRSR